MSTWFPAHWASAMFCNINTQGPLSTLRRATSTKAKSLIPSPTRQSIIEIRDKVPQAAWIQGGKIVYSLSKSSVCSFRCNAEGIIPHIIPPRRSQSPTMRTRLWAWAGSDAPVAITSSIIFTGARAIRRQVVCSARVEIFNTGEWCPFKTTHVGGHRHAVINHWQLYNDFHRQVIIVILVFN